MHVLLLLNLVVFVSTSLNYLGFEQSKAIRPVAPKYGLKKIVQEHSYPYKIGSDGVAQQPESWPCTIHAQLYQKYQK